MNKVTQEDIKKFNELYLELKTYSAVSRATGFSPSTVKKYIIDGYTRVDESKIKRYEGALPEFDPTIFRCRDWGHLCVLSNEEIEAVKEIWEEIEV